MKIMKIADFARILKSVYVLSAYLCRWPSFPDFGSASKAKIRDGVHNIKTTRISNPNENN